MMGVLRGTMRVLDMYRRPIEDLRISLTDRCNFRCTYCMPRSVYGHEYNFLPRNELLSFEDIVYLVEQLLPLGLKKVRLTGGEPLLRKDVSVLISMIREKSTELDIALTTNGVLLKQAVPSLKDAGLSRVTVSLDALNNEIFWNMADTKLFSPSDVIEGILQAKEFDLGLKVNTVVRKQLNIQEVLPLFNRMKEIGVELRFIEFMDVGETNNWSMEEVVTGEEIRTIITERWGLLTPCVDVSSAVARRWQTSDGYVFGCIESVSRPFCSDCSRLRISANGKLFTCLFGETSHDVKSLLKMRSDGLIPFIRDVWENRNDRYSELRSNVATLKKKPEMSYIGG